MNLVLSLKQFKPQYIYFQEKINNNIIENSKFIRIYYSEPNFTLNNISIKLDLKKVHYEKRNNQCYCYFNIEDHNDVIKYITQIEQYILFMSRIYNKIPIMSLSQQLSSGFFRIPFFSENDKKVFSNNSFNLKISGIWETETHFGITYKFFNINHL